jgi:hypothetical protein
VQVVTILQTEFTQAELLADHPVAEPLVVDGVRCHGGFDDEGAYVSPRTRNRWPAIRAWEEQRVEQFSTPILDVPLETWPENFPSVEQSTFLIRNGVPGPTISSLTRIGTVEGFGGMLRVLPVPDLRRCFDEDVTGTAIAHIDGGLFEAHARDECGFGDLAGHDRMWFVARDLAFGHPVTTDQTRRMLARMGIAPGRPTPGPSDVPGRSDASGRSGPPAASDTGRLLPDAIDLTLEMLVARMIGLLLIEVSAFHSFRWAEAVLGNRELVAGDGAAGALVSYIRADETPHVAWLRTALSEMRDRTWVGQDASRHPGGEMIGRVWDRALSNSLVLRRRENINFVMGEVLDAVAGRADGDALVDEMLSMGSVVRQPDGTYADRPTDRPPA